MGSLPDSKYIIKTDGYWFVEAHDIDPSKGYITVSAKGIVNGLSNIPNDGADFGPDSYNPNYSGSGIPYTQTSGIQEAVDYVVANEIATMVCIGHFTFSNINLNDGYNSIQSISQPIGILFPLIDAGNTSLRVIRIIGVGGQASTYETTPGDEMGYPTKDGTIFEVTDTTDYTTYGGVSNNLTNGSLFGIKDPSSLTLSHSNIQVEFADITFLSPNNGLPHTAIDGGAFAGLIVNRVSVDVSRTTSQVVSEPKQYGGVGVIFPLSGDMGVSYAPSLNITGYRVAIIYGAHFTSIVMHIYACYYGILPQAGYHPSQIDYLNIEQCVYNIVASEPNTALPSGGTPQSPTTIHILDIQKANPSSGTWNVNLADIYADATSAVNAFNLNIDYLIQNTAGSGLQTSVLDITNTTPANITLNIYRKRSLVSNYAPTPTTPTVPASGTAQSNTNPYPVNVYLYGGTVTVIDYTPNGGSATQVGTAGPATVRLNPGDSITLTYSAAPTWNWVAV